MHSLLEIVLSNALLACVPALAAVLVGLLCRRPALVHALWLLVLIKLITPPLVRVSVPWPAAPAAVASEDAEPAVALGDGEPAVAVDDQGEAVPEIEEFEQEPADLPVEDTHPVAPAAVESPPFVGWPVILVAICFTVSLGWIALALGRARRFSKALGHATPASPQVQKRVAELARLVGLAWCPEVRMVPARVTPMVWGVFRPLLLLPTGLTEQIGERGTDTLIVHELAHIRRRDHWARVLEFVVFGLFWWHPVVWLARREMRQAEECCCDAWVVRVLPGSARAYAVALVDALDFISESSPAVPPLACGIGEVADLKRRLKMILRSTTPPRLGLSAGLVVAALGLFVLPLVPALAQQERPARTIHFTEKAEGDLARMKEELMKKMADIERLKVQIEKVARDREAARKDQEKAKGPTTIHIQISGVEATPADLKKLAEALEKMVPGKERRIIILRGEQTLQTRPAGQTFEFKFAPAHPGQGGAGTGIGVVKPVPSVPALPATARVPAAPGQERRIEGLEKRLEAIMKELEAMRAEMKRGALQKK